MRPTLDDAQRSKEEVLTHSSKVVRSLSYNPATQYKFDHAKDFAARAIFRLDARAISMAINIEATAMTTRVDALATPCRFSFLHLNSARVSLRYETP